MRIRQMTIDDYDAVLALWQQVDGLQLRDADSRDAIARYLERNPGLSFVASDDAQLSGAATVKLGAEPVVETVIGALMAGHDGRRGYIQHLAVDPHCQRRGVGDALVKICLSALKNQGIMKSHILVLAENTTAKSFWLDSGWLARKDVEVFSFVNSDDPNI